MNHPWLVDIFSQITRLGHSGIYISAGGLVCLWMVFIAKNKRLAWMMAYFILAIIISGVVCDLFKIMNGRARPGEFFSQHLYGFYFLQFHNNFWSFPSGHSTTIAAFATAAYLLLQRAGWIFLMIVVLVGLSRIIVQAHYLSDVMAGAYLGFIISFWLHRFLISKWSVPEPTQTNSSTAISE